MTGGSGIKVHLGGAISTWTVTDANGHYTFNALTRGIYTVTPVVPGHALSPASREVTLYDASLSAQDFTARALASYDPLTADTLDAGRWQTPEFVRTISGGKALLSVRADGMASNLVDGTTYTSALTVSGAAGRVTAFQADVSVPAASASRTGAAVIYGGLRLYYQPAANRGLSFPGALRNELIVALELYDTGAGLHLRRRVAHCDDAACVTLGGSGITTADPVGFTVSDVNAWAPAAYDTTYTLGLSVNEVTGEFTWTVAGGAFGAGVSGSANVSSWAATAGLTLASTTDGFLSAQLHARTSDASAAGGGSGALTATFDNVMVGTNGAAAALHDDFSSMGSTEATGFSAARWGASANSAARASGAGLRLSAAAAPGATTSTTASTRHPTTFAAWQADLAITSDDAGLGAALLGGTFLNDLTAGAAHDGTGDVACSVVLRAYDAYAYTARCLNPACTATAALASYRIPADAWHPLFPGTVHTVFQQWDAASRTFVARLDGGPPLVVRVPFGLFTAPRVPGRWVAARATAPGSPGGPARVEAVVKNVLIAR